MKLSIIGSSGTYPVRGRPTSGYMVEQGATRIWCDAGPGTFMMLPIDPDLIGAIVISHQHPDHCLDLLTAFHAFRYRPQPRLGVPVYCPQAVIDKLREFVDDYQNGHLNTTFRFLPVGDGNTVSIREVVVRFRTTDHSVPTVASRWEANGRVFAYSADTGPEGEWMDVARDADLFLCEASYQGVSGLQPYPHHLTATEAGEIARRMGAKHLMLTHIPPHLDPTASVFEAEQAFDRPVALAVPGTSHKV